MLFSITPCAGLNYPPQQRRKTNILLSDYPGYRAHPIAVVSKPPQVPVAVNLWQAGVIKPTSAERFRVSGGTKRGRTERGRLNCPVSPRRWEVWRCRSWRQHPWRGGSWGLVFAVGIVAWPPKSTAWCSPLPGKPQHLPPQGRLYPGRARTPPAPNSCLWPDYPPTEITFFQVFHPQSRAPNAALHIPAASTHRPPSGDTASAGLLGAGIASPGPAPGAPWLPLNLGALAAAGHIAAASSPRSPAPLPPARTPPAPI